MKKTSLFYMLLLASGLGQVFGEEIKYFQPIFGHLHETPIKTSPSITTIQCGYPLKIIKSDKVNHTADWVYVEASDMKGFVSAENLSEKAPDCIQEKYPKYFGALNLDVSEMYYWGRLSDHYLQQRTKGK